MYPQWKILAWRFVRVGVAGGLGTMLTAQIVLRPDWSNGKLYFLTLGAAFLAGFISTAGKALRDYLSKGDETALVQKLPV